MSKSVSRPTDEQLAEREPTYTECAVCGELLDGVSETPFCSPACGRSQQL
jgi:ribosomal protein L34E